MNYWNEKKIIYEPFSFYFNYEAELKMNALREREINNSLERRLSEEQKLRGELDLLVLLFRKSAFASTVTFHYGPRRWEWFRLDGRGIGLLIFIRTCCEKKSIGTFHRNDFVCMLVDLSISLSLGARVIWGGPLALIGDDKTGGR